MHIIVIWQTAIGMTLSLLFITFNIKDKFNWTLPTLYWYCGMLTIAMTSFPSFFWHGMETTIIAGFQALVLHAFLFLTLVSLPFIFLNSKGIKILIGIISLIGLIDSYYLLIRLSMGLLPAGLMNNPALDSAFIACCLPTLISWSFFIKDSPLVKIFLLGPAVFMLMATKTSSGVLGLGVSVGAYILSKNKFDIKYILVGIISSITAAMGGYLLQGRDLFLGSGRYEIWRDSFRFWNSQASDDMGMAPYINRLIGTGPGTFFMYGPNLQLREFLKRPELKGIDTFFWMHSDLLQPLFEIGFIGFILMIIMIFSAIWKGRNYPALFASLCTYSAIALIQMPFRHFIFAVLGLCFVIQSLSPDKECLS